jgi:hypothetical protein
VLKATTEGDPDSNTTSTTTTTNDLTTTTPTTTNINASTNTPNKSNNSTTIINHEQQLIHQQQQQHNEIKATTSNLSQSSIINNPTPHRLPEGENAAPLEVIGTTTSDKLVIIMVGLPATGTSTKLVNERKIFCSVNVCCGLHMKSSRIFSLYICSILIFLFSGKTHIAKRICRFLSFFHDIPSQIFNVGDYRRQLCGAVQPAQWYDPNNVSGMTARTMACDAALTDLLEYMKLDGVRVSAFDATNSTKERRKHIVDVLKLSGLNVKYMFVESICDEEDVRCCCVCCVCCVLATTVFHVQSVGRVYSYHLNASPIFFMCILKKKQLLEENIRKVKLSTPDYRDMDPERAIADFKQRREMYMQVYEPVDTADGPHIKIINSREFIGMYLFMMIYYFSFHFYAYSFDFFRVRTHTRCSICCSSFHLQ